MGEVRTEMVGHALGRRLSVPLTGFVKLNVGFVSKGVGDILEEFVPFHIRLRNLTVRLSVLDLVLRRFFDLLRETVEVNVGDGEGTSSVGHPIG